MKKYGGTIVSSGLFILLLVYLFLPALPVAAGSGIGLGPASIEIQDAMRESQYKKSITIFNTGDQDTEYVVTVKGEAASWISFDDQGKPFERITVAAGREKEFGVTVTVPGDAANRDYLAKVTVTSVASDTASTGMGMGVALEAYCDITTTVSGTQNINGRVSGTTVTDQETGYPVTFKVFFENTGNVVVAPSVDVGITWQGNAVTSFNYQDTDVAPFSENGIIDVAWDTTGQAPGDYGAHVVVSLDSKQIYTEDLTFKILPLGSQTRSGELSDLSITGTLQPGNLAKVYAVFTNTGQIETWAEFAGEVYQGGVLVEAIKSDKLLVKRDATENMAAYFTPQQAGEYSVKGYVLFEGKKTNVLETNVTIQAGNLEGGESSQSSFNLFPIFGVIGVFIATIAFVALRKGGRLAILKKQ